LNREFTLIDKVHFAIRFLVLLDNLIFRIGVSDLNALNNFIVHFRKVFSRSLLHHFSIPGGHVTSLLHVAEFSLRTFLADLPHDTEERAIV
jgi:hypothetical protein